MEEYKYKVYIRISENSEIEAVESSAFYDEKELIEQGYVFLDEGEDGYIYGHAQPNYLNEKYGKPTYDENGCANFKYENGKVIELTEEEKRALIKPYTPEPTEQEVFNASMMKEIAGLKLSMRGIGNV